MNVSQYANSLFSHISGGEKQRVMIATALAQEPKILLLDEPTSFLDIGHSSQLMKLLTELNQESNITVLIISHDIQLAGRYCSRLTLIKEGAALADGATESVLTPELIEEAYNCKVDVIKDKNGKLLLSPE